jgi:hypothetical protein
MRNHLLSLFDSSHRISTVSLFAIGLILIIGSQITGTTDNLPGIAMLFTGIVVLFFALLHPWRSPMNYVILAGTCFGLIILEWVSIFLLATLHLEKYINEGIAMISGFLIFLPGIISGIIGSIICAIREKRQRIH